MNETTFEKLGYYELKALLKTYTVSQLGKDLIERLTPSTNLLVVQKRLKETEEAKTLLKGVGGVPLQGLNQIELLIEKIEKGGILEANELSQMAEFLRGCRKIKTFMAAKTSYAPVLGSYSLGITECKEIEDEINFAIRHNQVANEASKVLKKLRRYIEIEEGKIEEKLEKFLKNSNNKTYIQEFFITKRSRRLTIPIKSAYKNQVQGTVVETSPKGTTVFIEPETVNKHTTELLGLKSEEAVEEYQILSSLTGQIDSKLQEIKLNREILAEYDMVFAKGKYALSIEGIAPKMNEHGYIHIVQGKHPLLEGKVVPLDFTIGKDYRSLIITGPNAGGKTIVLKAIGLLTLAAQIGLHIPAKQGTELSVFERIFVDIGDNQSIENALSTFSAHIKNLAEIIKNSNKATLLLFDEIGSGTEPNEGAGLAIAILQELYEKGSMTVATTHYGEIKSFSSQHPDFENAAMQFNKETLEPLYKLLIGQAGESNALWIAHKMGISEQLLEKASHYIITKQYSLECINQSKVRKEKLIEKSEHIQQTYEKGDKVYLAEKEDYGIVYKPTDTKGYVTVLYKDELIQVLERRVKLEIKASELYPADYNMESLFVSFKERKLEKDIVRGSKKALKQLRKKLI